MTPEIYSVTHDAMTEAYKFWTALNNLPHVHPDRLLTQHVHKLRVYEIRHQALAWCVLLGAEKKPVDSQATV